MHSESNGEAERPRRSACRAPAVQSNQLCGSFARAAYQEGGENDDEDSDDRGRTHVLLQMLAAPSAETARPAPAMVRGRPHRSYCARAKARTQTGGIVLSAPACATNAAVAEKASDGLASGSRALLEPRTKGLRFHLSALHASQDESWPRPLTVKLRGRTTTADRGRGPTLSPGSRGPKQTTPHGPLQRLLDGGTVTL